MYMHSSPHATYDTPFLHTSPSFRLILRSPPPIPDFFPSATSKTLHPNNYFPPPRFPHVKATPSSIDPNVRFSPLLQFIGVLRRVVIFTLMTFSHFFPSGIFLSCFFFTFLHFWLIPSSCSAFSFLLWIQRIFFPASCVPAQCGTHILSAPFTTRPTFLYPTSPGSRTSPLFLQRRETTYAAFPSPLFPVEIFPFLLIPPYPCQANFLLFVLHCRPFFVRFNYAIVTHSVFSTFSSPNPIFLSCLLSSLIRAADCLHGF